MVLFAAPYDGRGQTAKGQSELLVGAGALTIADLSGFERRDLNGYEGCPAFSYVYRYYVTPKTTIGLNIVHQDFNTFLLDKDPRNNHINEQYTLIAPEMTFWYLDKLAGPHNNALRLYWMFSVGVTLGDYDRGTGVFPGLQFTPFGIRYGKAVAWYCELGWGNKGLVNMGFSYRPPNKQKISN